jgi:predicted outer membrane repeat protein
VVKAVAAGGIITFDCGPEPMTITMTATAKVRNTVSQVVLDGGNRVTLSGAGARRILYLNACDAKQGSAGGSCIDTVTPRLTVQNMAFKNGNSTGESFDGNAGGGAIFAYGGSLKVINSRFTGNKCDRTGPDLGGGAIRISYQGGDNTAYVVGSTFTGGTCSNGAALSSLHARWMVLNSVLSGNTAVGNGANPARAGTPGGGSGGAIYMDGEEIKLTVDGTLIEKNHAKEGGGAIFFVSNNKTGTVTIRNSKVRNNPSDVFENFPGMFYIGKGNPIISNSTMS